jgi:required for meiotic nuclear division protein 1
MQIQAIQLAEAISIKKLKGDYKGDLHFANASELFYHTEETGQFLYIFDYGVVVFGHFDALSKSEFIKFLSPYLQNALQQEMTEDYRVEINEQLQKAVVKDDHTMLPSLDIDAIRMVMLNTGQSVALDYYEGLIEEMLAENKVYIKQLEQKGKINVGHKPLLQHIGKVLNIKNSIIDNLYILDDPSLVWDDENLTALNRKLKVSFDSFARFKDLNYRLEIIEDSLTLFTDLIQHRQSYWLEIIIIVLILIEVIKMFVDMYTGTPH